MEEKIIDVFDTLDISETDKLLYSNLNMKIDSKTMKKIKKKVYQKAGFKSYNRIISRAFIAIAAGVVLVMLSAFTIGVDNVANAVGRLFSFIPGYAIVENNKTIEYVLEGQNLKAESDEAIITIKNAIATKDNISISFEMENKNFDESKLLEEKQKEREELEKGGQLKKQTILLYANGKEYRTSGFSIGGGGKTDSVSADFQVDTEDINSKTAYRLEYKDYNLSVNFKLHEYDSFNSLDEIGPTATLNDISITAVTRRENDKLSVELYPINKSEYTIDSFTKVFDDGYEGKDLNLKTSEGIREYTTPGSSRGANNKFYFDITPEDKELVLNIPYLAVQSSESQLISVEIPREGEKLTLNKKVMFKSCTMTITDVERINSEGNEYGALRMNFQYENKDKNRVMYNAQFMRANLFGMTQSGGYSSTPDKNDIIKLVDFNLEKGEDSVLRLKIEKPEYYLLGEYKLELK